MSEQSRKGGDAIKLSPSVLPLPALVLEEELYEAASRNSYQGRLVAVGVVRPHQFVLRA